MQQLFTEELFGLEQRNKVYRSLALLSAHPPSKHKVGRFPTMVAMVKP